MELKPISISEQIKEAKRELGLRYGFYTKQVKAGRMKQEDADRNINAQRNIVATLEAVSNYSDEEPAALNLHLFGLPK